MRLYLCGGGSGGQISKALSSFSKVLDKTKPILYVPLAMNEDKYDSCYKWFSGEIKNISVDKFYMVKSSRELSKINLFDYCAIFIGGGNTYKLLNEIRKNGNDKKILNYLKNDGIIFGGSAGASIFGKDIDCCLLEDKNSFGIKSTKGLNLLNNYSILCHLNANNLDRNCKFLEKYSQKYKVVYLPEENVIVIDNNKVSIIGDKKYVIFDSGHYGWHYCSDS